MRPTSHAPSLSRRSTGLSPAHSALIKLLAERAIDEYLREVEATDDREKVRP